MAYDHFLYEVRDTLIGEQTLRFAVKLGYYEERRWKEQDGSYKPGMAFASSSSVDVEDKGLWDGNGVSQGREMQILVSQSGNSSVTIAEAEERHEINRQALELAWFIRDQLDIGVGLRELVSFLKGALDVGHPVSIKSPFRYTGGVKKSLAVFSAAEVKKAIYG